MGTWHHWKRYVAPFGLGFREVGSWLFDPDMFLGQSSGGSLKIVTHSFLGWPIGQWFVQGGTGPLATANKSSQGVVLLLVCALTWLNIFHFVTMRERRNRVSPPTAQLQHLMNQIFLSVFMRKDYQMRPVKHAKLICLHSVTNHSLLKEVELLSIQSSFQLDAG